MDNRWPGYAAEAYLVAVALLPVNAALAAWGSPAPYLGWLLTAEGEPPGTRGLAVMAWLGVVVIALAVWTGSASTPQWQIVAAVALWTGAPAVSMVLRGSLQDSRFWSIAVICVAVSMAATVVPRTLLRQTLFGLSWFFGWGSVVAGLADLACGWPQVLIGGDARYGRWLSALGLPVGEVPSLNGVTPGRIFLAMTCASLLVYSVRSMLRRSYAWWMWIMPAGLIAAAAWSFGRGGLLGMVVGLAAAVVPWERWRAMWAYMSLLLIMLVPLGVAAFTSDVGDGTTQWRFDLWAKYASNPDMWTPFGIGPETPPDIIAGHAHHQMLESLATGGWLAAAGLLGFLYLATVAARRAAATDGRATLAVLFAAATIFQADVLTFAPTFNVPNSAQTILIAVVVSAASITGSGRPGGQEQGVLLNSQQEPHR